jgi:hypothetical protein
MADPYALDLAWYDAAQDKHKRLTAPILNLSGTKNSTGDHFEITVEAEPAVVDLAVGRVYQVTLETPAKALAKQLDCVMVSATLQRTASNQPDNMILIFEDVAGFKLGTGTTFGDLGREMPKPPKFSSIEEADAWMEKHEERATGALDKILGKRSNR